MAFTPVRTHERQRESRNSGNNILLLEINPWFKRLLYYSDTQITDDFFAPDFMQSVGESLRAARLDLGVTLEQVSARTRISVKNLRAIEADELDSISSAFFYKSFARQFAQELGLDYSSLSAAVQAAVKSFPEPRMPGQGDAPSMKISRARKKRGSGLRWFWSFASLGLMLVACSTFYAMWQNSRAEIQASIASFVQSVTSNSAPGRAAKRSGSQVRVHAPPVPATPIPVPPVPAPSNSFELKLSALEATWLSVVADGEEVFSGILQQSQSKTLEGYESARVRTGNAGGLNVEFNGKLIGSLGPRGQVRTVVFSKDTYEIVAPAPHMALIQFIPQGE
jgi:cytoskeleton protein RodZ